MTEFHNYDWISQVWLNLTTVIEFHGYDWISQLWLDFTSMTEFHIFNWIGKNTLYGIDNTEISETVLKYQISDFP